MKTCAPRPSFSFPCFWPLPPGLKFLDRKKLSVAKGKSWQLIPGFIARSEERQSLPSPLQIMSLPPFLPTNALRIRRAEKTYGGRRDRNGRGLANLQCRFRNLALYQVFTTYVASKKELKCAFSKQ